MTNTNPFTFKTPTGWLRIQPWPEPRAEHSYNEKDWFPHSPVWRFFIANDDRMTSRTIPNANPIVWFNDPERISFCASIPDDIRILLEPFTDRQFNLLALFSKNENEMRELMQSNPVLAYCLANVEEFRFIPAGHSAERAKWLLGRKQKEMLKWIRFPDSPSVVKLFRKIVPDALGIAQMRMLRNTMDLEPRILKVLAHIPRIDTHVLSFVSNLNTLSILSNRLLLELVECDRLNGMVDYLIEIRSMQKELDPQRSFPIFQSIKKVDRYHEALVTRFNEMIRRRKEQKERRALEEYEEPPVPGTKNIIPITSRKSLIREGRAQHNCVAGYHAKIFGGRTYIYRVLRPERATLELERSRNGGWYCTQLKGLRNREVTQETKKQVNEWLEQHAEKQAASSNA